MFPSSSFVTVLTCLALVGCVKDGGDDTAADNYEPVVEDYGVQPQAGNWTIVTTGWSNDDCNAAEGLLPPTSITIADVSASSFSITFYENDARIGEGSTACTYEADDVYGCDGFTHGFSYTDIDASISMTGVMAVTVTSETAAAGSGDLVLECTGTDCGVVASQTNSGSLPCDTTLNWTAEAN